jgi:hypothetical protein
MLRPNQVEARGVIDEAGKYVIAIKVISDAREPLTIMLPMEFSGAFEGRAVSAYTKLDAVNITLPDLTPPEAALELFLRSGELFFRLVISPQSVAHHASASWERISRPHRVNLGVQRKRCG